jgi:hypothetical protein
MDFVVELETHNKKRMNYLDIHDNIIKNINDKYHFIELMKECFYMKPPEPIWITHKNGTKENINRKKRYQLNSKAWLVYGCVPYNVKEDLKEFKIQMNRKYFYSKYKINKVFVILNEIESELL